MVRINSSGAGDLPAGGIPMIETTPWNWDKVEEAYWLEPAEEVRSLLDRWRGAGLSRVLDLGCGLGRHALLFARAGFSVTGYDLSEAGLARMKAMAAEEGLLVSAAVGDLRSLPFSDASFDCVLAYRSIYHCDYPGLVASIGEARRVLNPGGELFANFLSKESPYYGTGEGATSDPRVRMKLEEGGAVLPHCYLDEAELRSLLSLFDAREFRHGTESAERSGSIYFSVLASSADSASGR
jgi:SAM-dependent methyltransferase